MAITTQSFGQILSNAATAIQGAATALVDFTIGSVLRAVTEAIAGIALWLQGVALEVAALTRFSTSSGTDADTWAADYQFTRLPAQPATGPVVFSRFTPTLKATIPAATVDSAGNILTPGFIVQNQDGTQQYSVYPDTTQSAYNASLNAYVILGSISSATVTVKSLTAGVASNAAAGIINTLGASIPGVDTVNNAVALTNGADQESDQAFKGRFPLYIASLEKATPSAVQSAIQSVQQDVSDSVIENFNLAGSQQLGYFYAIVDDGSGAPPGTFLANVSNAIDAVRPIGSVFNVFGPALISANISMTLTTAAGYLHSAIVAQVVSAITNYVNSLPIGTTLPYTRLAQLAYDASAAITNVGSVTLNSGTADLVPANNQVIKIGTLLVS